MMLAMKWTVGFALIMVFATQSQAAILLDQSYTETPTNLGSSVNEGFEYIGETFTAGITGTLVQVRVDVFSTMTTPLQISIFDTTAGIPNSTLLTSQLLSGAQSLISDPITLSNPIAVVSGHVYLLAVDYPSIAHGTGLTQGTWNGHNPGNYAGGTLYFGNPSGPLISWSQVPEFDVHFQTYVDNSPAVPEPASLAIWSIGALGCATAGYRRRRQAA